MIYGKITKIADFAFSHCRSLTDIEIPESVISIDDYAFYNYSALTEVKLSNGLTNVFSDAFNGCTNLQKVIIPESVKCLYKNSFSTNTLLMVYENSYAHKFAVRNDLLYFVYNDTNEPQVVTKDNVTYVLADGEATAINCDKTATEITVPEKVNDCTVTKMIATFNGCTKLKKVTLPESITEISNELFRDCQNLTYVNIPSNTTK